jgi:tetratricopeptide (TPR) repeat protein
MAVLIKIKEKSFDGEYFEVGVTIGDAHTATVRLPNPYDKEIEKHLEWYFEQYLSEPYTPFVTIEKHKGLLVSYGEDLFEKIFGNNDLHSQLEKIIRENEPESIAVEIVGESPAFHSIHWESLKASNSTDPLSAVGVLFYRKNTKPHVSEVRVESSPHINLLVVTARPDEEDDVNYRTIQRPLINVIKKAKLKVNPYILRPGTYRSLVRHLEETPDGFYHIIHFDLHGGFMDYQTLKDAAYDGKKDIFSRDGLGEVVHFSGKKHFISFESDKKGVSVPVDAAEIAALLKDKHIPVCIFNACQTAKQSMESATGFGRELMKEGIQLVLAMRYSISVSASEILMEKIYEEIFNGKHIEKAIACGRKELYNRKKRSAWLGYEIELEDWLMPVVYKNEEVNFKLESSPEAEKIGSKKKNGNLKYYQVPQYGFFGRDLDILKIEKRLLVHNRLHLQGMGGVGKTTLLRYMTFWWQDTGFIENAFYFPYDHQAWTTEQILLQVAQQILSRSEFEHFQSKSFTEQKKQILEYLNIRKFALILDNIDPITGEDLAIPKTLTKNEIEELNDFISGIKAKSFVIIGSRSDETWINGSIFRDNRYLLRGFDKETIYAFSKKVLENLNFDMRKMAQDFDFIHLLNILGGYPLLLQVVLPQLKTKSPKTILEELKMGEGSIDDEIGKDETQSIIKCVEYSFSNLSEDARKLLLCLAPFQYAVNVLPGAIGPYFNELKKFEIFQDYSFEKFDMVIKEAVKNGLMNKATPDSPFEIMVLQPAFTYFLKKKLLRQDTDFLEKLDIAFIQYYNLASGHIEKHLNSQNSREHMMSMIGMIFEYQNIFNAMEKSLKLGRSINNTHLLLDSYLQYTNKHKTRMAISEMILNHLERFGYEKLDEHLKIDYIFMIDKIGNIFLNMGEFEKARASELKALNLFNDSELKKENPGLIGVLYQNLGEICRSQGDFKESMEYSEKALKIYQEFKDVPKQAEIFQNLGNLAIETGQGKKALKYYYKALKIHKKQNNVHWEGRIYLSLGNASVKLGDYQKSIVYYKEAGQLLSKFNDYDRIGLVYIGLGGVYKSINDLESSRYFYKEAVKIFIRLKNKHNEGLAYLNLGIITMELEDFEESKEYFKKALRIFVQLDERVFIVRVIQSSVPLIVAEDNSLGIEIVRILKERFSDNEIIEIFPRLIRHLGTS